MVWSMSKYVPLTFGCTGAPATASFLTPGFAAINANEVQVPSGLQSQIYQFTVNQLVAPGGVLTVDYTVNIGGAASAATVTITGVATTATYNGAVAVPAGSLLSIECTSANVGTSSDVTATLTLLRLV